MILTKICCKCGETKPLDEFNNKKDGKYGKGSHCRKCDNEKSREYHQNHREERREYRKGYYEETGREKRGHQSMYENKLCPQYLGIVIGERLCRHLFKDVEVMPYGNPKFDIICNRGKKIDVKISCIRLGKNKKPTINNWTFNIRKNTVADFFILVAFDNIESLNPIHMWMIPGNEINNNLGESISSSTIHKWDKWKKDIKHAQLCCAEMKITD